MLFVYQVSWAIVGLFLCLLLVCPWIRIRFYCTKVGYVFGLMSCVAGILTYFSLAWFFVFCVVALVLIKLLAWLAAALTMQKTKNKAMECKV